MGRNASAARSAMALCDAPITLPRMSPAMRPMTTRRTRIGRESYRFFVALLRDTGRAARAGAAFFVVFLPAALAGAAARFAATRTLFAGVFLAGTALVATAFTGLAV